MKLENTYIGWYVFSTSSYGDEYQFFAEVVGTAIPVRGTKLIVLVRSKAPELDLWKNSIGDTTPILVEYIIRKATELEIALC